LKPAKIKALLLAGAIAGSACASRPEDPVEALLTELEEAAEARDADRFAARLGDRFQASGSGSPSLARAEAVASLRRYLAAYESIALTVHQPEVEAREKGALVRCAVEFSGRANTAFGLGGLLPGDAVYRFELDLVDDGGLWRVERASWTPAAPGP